MTGKHTPGPWDAGASLISHAGREIALVREPRRHRDGSPWIPTSAAETMAEYEANVSLIKAAPDMHESLVALTDWMREHTGPNDPNSPHALLIKAMAVLAMVEGR